MRNRAVGLFILFLSLSVLFPLAVAGEGGPCSDRCATERIPTLELEPVVSGRVLDVTVTPGILPMGPGGARILEVPDGYSLVDTIERTVWIPMGRSYVASALVDSVVPSNTTLSDTLPPTSLTADAWAAVDKAPTWLQDELADAFRFLSTANQDYFAAIINNAVDPYVDEIAFTIAHTPENVLTDANFYSGIITENVEVLYQIDQDLLYADIIDYGDAVSGGDYYSTVRYRVIDENGVLFEKEYDRDLYYWFIVHPKLSDELATYINPDAPFMDTPAAPPAGKFWRRYIYDSSDPNPNAPPENWLSLGEMLAGCQTLWNSKSNTEGAANGAIGIVSQWMDTVMRYDLPPSGERSIQPVRILHNHCGRCGEQQDLLAAAGRTALIPSVCSSAWANDHVWAEFFENDKWRLWDCSGGGSAVIDPPTYYDHWAFGGVSGVMDWRGDGYVWTVTDKYTPYAVLVARALDRNGRPVDGARIMTATFFNDGVSLVILVWGYTDSRGECSFLLGDQKTIYGRWDANIGRYPEVENQVVRIIDSTEPDQTYTWEYDNDHGVGDCVGNKATPVMRMFTVKGCAGCGIAAAASNVPNPFDPWRGESTTIHLDAQPKREHRGNQQQRAQTELKPAASGSDRVSFLTGGHLDPLARQPWFCRPRGAPTTILR